MREVIYPNVTNSPHNVPLLSHCLDLSTVKLIIMREAIKFLFAVQIVPFSDGSSINFVNLS